MKKIKHIILFVFIFLGINAYSQNINENYYYYYKGKKKHIKLDKNHLSIHSNNKTKLNKVSISEIKNISKIQTESSQNNTNYWKELELDNLNLNQYLNKVESIKKKNPNLSVLPYFETESGKKMALSRYFYVKLKHSNDYKILVQEAKKHDVSIVKNNKLMPLWYTLVVNSKTNNALNISNAFFKSNKFEKAEPEFILFDLLNQNHLNAEKTLANDPLYKKQWGLKNTGQYNGKKGIDIKAEDAWQITQGNSNIKIAVYDEGYETNHPDLKSNNHGNGFDTESNSSPSVVHGNHGTACAGIISAKKDNSIGVSGVSPNTKLMSVSIKFGSTLTYQKLANGINWAWKNGADIISNSWGGGSGSSLFDDAITNALTKGRKGKGCVVVFSSGNDDSNVNYPANSNPNILAVGAMSQCGERKNKKSCDKEDWWGSNYGNELDVVAPGVKIGTTDRQGRNGYSTTNYHDTFNGTSSSCPMAAGVAALVLSVNPNLTATQVNTIIEKSAQKTRTDLYTYSNKTGRPNGKWNNQMGYGLVNAYRAVQLATGCPLNITITQNVNSGINDKKSATNSITATNKINNGGKASYNAGKFVRLKPGFHAKPGSKFRGFIKGCRSIAEIEDIEITENDENYSTENELQAFNSNFEVIKIFPNPTKNNINIQTDEDIENWSLLNAFGKSFVTGKANDKVINTRNLNKGIYILRFVLKNGDVITKKVIKE